MLISDWISDVCSSDLPARGAETHQEGRARPIVGARTGTACRPAPLRQGARARSAALRRRGEQGGELFPRCRQCETRRRPARPRKNADRSEEHTSELQSLMRISYAVFCLKKKTRQHL